MSISLKWIYQVVHKIEDANLIRLPLKSGSQRGSTSSNKSISNLFSLVKFAI